MLSRSRPLLVVLLGALVANLLACGSLPDAEGTPDAVDLPPDAKPPRDASPDSGGPPGDTGSGSWDAGSPSLDSGGSPPDVETDAARADLPSTTDAGGDAPRADADAVAPGDVPRADAGAPRCTGSASGQSSIWTCTSDLRARQRCVSGAVQTQACAHGCLARPSGTDDECAPEPPSGTLPACAHHALLRWGLHPDASDHLRCAGVSADRITQTIGDAAASAGTHARDGWVAGQPYSAATDLSVRGLSTTEVRALLGRLADQGFAAWYRWPGHDGWPSSEAPHIHAIYVGCAMKASLRAQVSDWLVGRNGLTSHTTYTFYTWTSAQRALLRAVFGRYN